MRKILFILFLLPCLAFGQVITHVSYAYPVAEEEPAGGGYEATLIADDSVKAYYITTADNLTESGGDVSQLNDISGNGWHLTETSFYPNWAGDSLYFGGTTSQRLRNTSFTQTNPYMVIAVMSAHAWTDGDSFINLGDAGGAGNTAIIQGAASPRIRMSSDLSIFSTAGTPALNNKFVVTAIIDGTDGTSSSLQINQDAANTGQISRDSDQIVVGGLSGGAADFAIWEFMIVGGTKTSQWISDVQDSLAVKYNITF